MTARISPHVIGVWRKMAEDWLAANTQITCADVKIGANCWIIAHKAGIYHDVMELRVHEVGLYDSHVQTALEKIFPGATFLDEKRY